jgi:hypothetical protein
MPRNGGKFFVNPPPLTRALLKIHHAEEVKTLDDIFQEITHSWGERVQ